MDERNDHITKVIKNLLDRKLSGQQLWNVLSALRGPDSENDEVKNATTGVIRHALGFRQTFMQERVTQESQNIFVTDSDDNQFLQTRQKISRYSHFGDHAVKAFEALGLKWNSVNR